jgi:DNA-binding transcriptional ArsR family regulator
MEPTLPLPSPIPEALAEVIADRLRAIAEPTRIRILDYLRDGEQSVQDITAALGTSQQNASKHLSVLYRVGILSRTRDGNHVRYAIADSTVFALCESVCDGIQRQLDELSSLVGEVAR